MKVGDMVRLKGSFPGQNDRVGVLINCGKFSEDWWDILDCDGRMIVWPETQIEVIDETR